MFRWAPYPFLRFTPFLMLGIGVAHYVNVTGAAIGLALVFLVYTGLTFFLPKSAFSRYHSWGGLLAMMALVLLGIIRAQQHDTANVPDHLLHQADSANYYTAQVASQPEPRKNSYRVYLKVEQVVASGEQAFSRSGRVVAYQPQADSCQLLRFGDRILVKGLPDRVEAPKNPGEFDYRQFLAYQGIYHQQYLPADHWVILQSNNAFSWRGWTEELRNRCQEILLTYVRNPEAQGIALAITLGQKSHLEKDIQTAYAAAGAMHVLAVSGLHVGIIYLIVNFLLKPLLGLPKAGVVVHTVISVSVLWGYAALTGFSPSVQRAAVMFSFVIIGKALNRQSSIYNTLACSAFVLLWVNPYLMYSVGFQLSYLAVFGIVYLQPKIVAWWQPSNGLLNWFWGITAVSLAAQIATFPLSLYYFHQFPVYFWLPNVVVILGALAMLPLGLTTVLLGFTFPVLATGVGVLLEWLILAINFIVGLVQQLPGSTIEQVYTSPSQTWLLYFAMVFLLALFHYRKLRYLSLSVLAMGLVMIGQVVRNYQQSNEVSFTVYHTKAETHLDFTQGFNNHHWGSWNDDAEYHILPNHIQKGIRTQLVGDSNDAGFLYRSTLGVTLLQYQGKVLALVEEKLLNKPAQPISVDYVIVANDAVRNLDQLDKYFYYDQLIIDATNSYYTTQRLSEQAQEKHIAYHSVPLKGALTINLDQE
ncbi:MAG: ComEC/Rec2 family competence protein [Bacteroidota bacterium]